MNLIPCPMESTLSSCLPFGKCTNSFIISLFVLIFSCILNLPLDMNGDTDTARIYLLSPPVFIGTIGRNSFCRSAIRSIPEDADSMRIKSGLSFFASSRIVCFISGNAIRLFSSFSR